MRGIHFAMLILAFSVISAFVAGVGFTATIHTSTGPHLDSQRSAAEGAFDGDTNVSNLGSSSSPSFFGVNTQTTDTIGILYTVVTAGSSVLQWFWVPKVLADGLAAIAKITAGIMVLSWLRGFMPES